MSGKEQCHPLPDLVPMREDGHMLAALDGTKLGPLLHSGEESGPACEHGQEVKPQWNAGLHPATARRDQNEGPAPVAVAQGELERTRPAARDRHDSRPGDSEHIEER